MADEVTPLTPEEEKAFRQWIAANRIIDLDNPDSHYDYRGFWKETKGAAHPPGTEMHFPDTYKQHGHPTFSVKSKYSKGPNDGGHWNGDTFVPAKGNHMADQNQEPVIIVDDDGNEHEFPPGMDPRKAALIVRDKVRAAHIAAQHETDNPTEAMLNSLRDTASRTVEGIKSGVGAALNPVNTIRAIPNLVNALTNPYEIMKQGYESEPAVMEQVKKIASGDPEAGGEAIGQLGTALVAPKVVPMVKPALAAAGEAIQDNPALAATARGTGRFITGVAKHSSFPIRIAGAHQVLSGNVPAGMAMVMAPELAEGVGNRLISLGTAPGAALTTPTGQILRMKMDLEQAANGDAAALKNVQDRIAKTQSELADRLAVARNDAEVASIKSMQSSLSQLSSSARRIAGARTAAELNDARLALVRERLAGLKEGPTRVTKRISAKNEVGGTESSSTSFSPEAETNAVDSDAEALVKSGYARNLDDAQQILKNRAGAVPSHTPSIRPMASHTSSLVQEPGSIAQEIGRIAADVASGNRGPIRPVVSHGPTPADFEAALNEQLPESTTGRPAQQPVSGVRPSATSREMSATPGLSRNDVQSIGMNPDIPIKKLTVEAANKILQDRAMRARDYREMAALKKRLEQLIANSNQ